MRLILVALLFAISYAQTARRKLQVGVTEHPIDSGCPTNTGTSDLTLNFDTAKVIHQNLNGHYCDQSRWKSDLTGSVDGTVVAGSNFGDVVFDGTLPDSCHDIDPNTGLPLAEILYCEVGFSRENEPLCLRIVDMGGKYKCKNTLKCGSVKTEDEDAGFYGQIQLNQGGDHEADIHLRFTVVYCAGDHGTQCTDRPWDDMFMTFLDIDGTEPEEEEIILFQAFDYYLPEQNNLDTQWKYPAAGSGDMSFYTVWPASEMETFSDNMFPNMFVQIDDPEGVYRYQDDAGDWIDNEREGDVVIRNIPQNGNGNHDNPTDLLDLTDGQAARSVIGQWVSERWKNNHFRNDASGAQRTFFDVSFGTMKRTILFAGEARAIISECDTCASGFFNRDPAGTCVNNGIPMFSRVCFLPNHETIAVLDPHQCNADYCCDPNPTSHGDPIIWTFNEECYDLNKDGLYLATGHPSYDHEVKIAVHNDFMREIQVVDTTTGEIVLAINNLGEVLGDDTYDFLFEQGVSPCPEEMKNTECDGEYAWFKFDANSFKFVVQQLRHDYLDPALRDGEIGFHLDIYPRPYNKVFKTLQDGYKGLYFENPLPEELDYCLGGSEHMNN